ncbi:helix-turn-helix domain-containing protein [Pseudonocardia kujensis]|uniref:IclR family transcriptional regulator domain-containing protein n=1 Tax=Pseudonocardia kujensis TaxID=1128675 RepID=UPI001E3B26EC|nr:IclR family transcriptional regulator C-terminal domain-containing protein [Pseudonocardia kujensis]MCE0761504.1 helix-turn-helix domain-containing protein [Pseudonocardia kujensis]
MSTGDTEREPERGTERDYVQSLERGFAVLLAFDEEMTTPTLAELAARTGLSRPAVRRLLLTLQRLGYVANHGTRWSLTPRVLTIGQHYSAANARIGLAQPHLLRLAERTGESASLAELDGADVVYVARVPVRRIMSINVTVGSRVPAHATSMGRVLLAWAGPAAITRFLEQAPLHPHTPRTITDPTDLRMALAEVREQGWSIVDGELEEGLVSAAAPVRDRTGAVVAALASSTSAGRLAPERLREETVPLLVETATAISTELGWSPRTPPVVRDGFF